MAQADAKKEALSPTAPANPRESRELKLAALREKGLEPYPPHFPRSHQAGELQAAYAGLENGVETEDEVAVAGRIMAMRNNGMFLDLADASGKIQVFCHKDSMDEEMLSRLDLLDIGDIVGALGTVRRTPRGELSVRAREVRMLAKSMLPLPEKYHGLTDIEQRSRQRYLDLIMNEESREVLRKRSKIVSFIRNYMEGMGAIEVETPILNSVLGGANARPFTTHHNALNADFYLRIATELPLKRLIVGGIADTVFEIGRLFRNEGISVKHNPEFTTIEAYHSYKDYFDIMDLTEDLIRKTCLAVNGTMTLEVEGQTIDFGKPFRRATMIDLIKDATGVDFLPMSEEEARAAAKTLGVKVEPYATWGDIVAAAFDEHVEATLIQPTHVMDSPMDISPLAKVHRDNPRLVERFETYVNGRELLNAYSELNDPAVQRARFEEQVAQKDKGNEEAQMMDDDYVTALEYGMPPTGGWGMGIDRFAALLTSTHNIRDVIAFPTMKPLKPQGAPERAKPAAAGHKTVDETKKRFVVVVNEKEDNPGRLMNAVGHAMAGLVGAVAKGEDFCFTDYTDGDGAVHPSISHYPVIALKAKNSNAIRKVRDEATARGVPFTDFLRTMTIGGTQAQLDATKGTSGDAVEYLGLVLFGETETVREITKKLSLYG